MSAIEGSGPKSGRQFGVIDVHLEFPIKRIMMGKTKTSFEQAATYVTEATRDGCIDGSVNGSTVKLATRMEGQGELTQGEMKFKMTFKTTGSGQESQKELAGK